MREGCCYHKVKVPKGFDYDAVEQALERGEEVPWWDEACYVAAQMTIQEYRREFISIAIEGKDGGPTVDYEYQTLPFYYTLHPPKPVDWSGDSVEDMIHNPSFWDAM